MNTVRPGVYRGVSNDAYHHGPGDSKSGLDLVHKAPINLHAVRTGAVERKPTPAQALGTAFHALVLEPEVFAAEYALPFVPPTGALCTVDDIKTALSEAGAVFKASAKKADLETIVRMELPDAVLLTDARDAYDAENADRQVIGLDDWDRLHRMRDAVMAHPAARKLLSAPGESELSAYWYEPVVDPKTGEQLLNEDGTPAELLLRCRPDKWRYDGILIDLKSTSPGGASPDAFAKSIHDWRYHVQHPMYLRGAAEALKAADRDDCADGMAADFERFQPPRAFVFVAVENDACVVDGIAKGVGVYQLQPDSVALGVAEMREDIATLHACTQANRWPGYSDLVQPIELPAYAFTKAAARMGATD
jgi:exodeoxyribonuclease VIII